MARTDFEAELRRGYETGKYQGLPFKQIVKYRAEAGDNFKAGVTRVIRAKRLIRLAQLMKLPLIPPQPIVKS